jgi:RNA-binding protein NOB1
VLEHIQEQNDDQCGDVPQRSDDALLNRESANPTVPVVELPTPEDDPIPHSAENSDRSTESPIFEDPSDGDDGEGEWITPSNSALHKSRALEMLPDADGRSKAKADTVISVGCMTADFAIQNVLLQMGLNLVNVEGKRIEKLKTWVLRCHACFK